MKLIIDIPEDVYKRTKFYKEFRDLNDCVTTIKALENGTPFDQLRAEIERLTITEGGEDYIRKMAELYSLKIKVLQIIDKYRESED